MQSRVFGGAAERLSVAVLRSMASILAHVSRSVQARLTTTLVKLVEVGARLGGRGIWGAHTFRTLC